jgi:membrane-bound lytic murein transglycosylase B
MRSLFFVPRLFALSILSIACALLFALPLPAHAQLTSEERATLQAELDQVEREIAANQGDLTELQKERTTLERDIQILDTKIRAAQLQVRQSDLELSSIRNDIGEKLTSISQVDAKVTSNKASLAQLIRRTREIDDISLAELILSGSLSDAFSNIDNYETLHTALDQSFKDMAALRRELSDRKIALDEKHDEAEKAREVQVLARNAIQRDEAEKQHILNATKGQEKAYQELIASKEQEAAAIRARLFDLRDATAISFGQAYAYAQEASAATGVRPALVLAILTQESDLGKNVGSCYVTNLETGDGVGKNTGRAFDGVMKSPRDTVPFKAVTDALGRDWSTTPVSCPLSSGYGGAMGPAQFIPSTWVLYQDRLATIMGVNVPDPWSGRTAVFATALLMADNGADAGTFAAERLAALRYYAGWANANKASNRFYGDSVMSLAADIQAEIDILNR